MLPFSDPNAGNNKSDQLAAQHLFAQVYPELKRIASRHIRSEQRRTTMQITALVHETYLRMARRCGQDSIACRDRGHFFALASRAMRNILVDRARARLAKKRDAPVEGRFHGFLNTQSFMDLHEALNRLAVLDQRQAQIVEMRFFGGCTEEEIAEALGLSSRTVKRDWSMARAWLFGELSK